MAEEADAGENAEAARKIEIIFKRKETKRKKKRIEMSYRSSLKNQNIKID